jgi:hypothetical protein
MSETQVPGNSSKEIRRFVYEAVRVLVDRPEGIVMEEQSNLTAVHIRVIVHPSDFGKQTYRSRWKDGSSDTSLGCSRLFSPSHPLRA